VLFRSAEFRSYFEHVRSLRFEDRPDYDYLKRLFRELFFRKGFSYDNMFDWELLSMQKQRVRDIDETTGEERMGEGGGKIGEDDGEDIDRREEAGMVDAMASHPTGGMLSSEDVDGRMLASRGTEEGGGGATHGYQTRGAVGSGAQAGAQSRW